MGRFRFTAEQIIGEQGEAEVLQGQGLSIGEAIRRLEVSEQTYILSLEKGIWRDACRSGETIEGVGGGKRPIEENRG